MQIFTRHDFANLLNVLGLTGYAVEVGVYQGHFAFSFLNDWEGKKLFCVDPWKHQAGVKLDASNVSQEEHDKAYDVCKYMLSRFGERVEIMRDFSISAAETFLDNSLDFVYLDARHDYRSVTSDLEAWYPKVKIGGIIAGHDYKNSFVRNNLVEVKRAVDNFFLQKETVHTTIEDNLPSWYVIRKNLNY